VRLLWLQGSHRVLVSVVDARPPDAFKLELDGHQPIEASTTPSPTRRSHEQRSCNENGSHRSLPTPNRRAALVSASAVTERVANGGHAFAYEGAPTVPPGRTIADDRAQGNGRQTPAAQSRRERSPSRGPAPDSSRDGLACAQNCRSARALVGNPASGALASIERRMGIRCSPERRGPVYAR
jgi:hypothetical protein